MPYFATCSKLGPVLALWLGLAGLAAAQPPPAARASAFQSLLDCRTLPDPERRLACYDAAAAGLGAAEQQGEIVVVDRDMARAARRQAFGFNLPSLDMFNRAAPSEEADRLTALVTNAYQGGDGKWVFELEGGAVWAQNDSERLSRSPRKGSRVEIRKTAMGGYFLNPDGQRAIRARRLR